MLAPMLLLLLLPAEFRSFSSKACVICFHWNLWNGSRYVYTVYTTRTAQHSISNIPCKMLLRERINTQKQSTSNKYISKWKDEWERERKSNITSAHVLTLSAVCIRVGGHTACDRSGVVYDIESNIWNVGIMVYRHANAETEQQSQFVRFLIGHTKTKAHS